MSRSLPGEGTAPVIGSHHERLTALELGKRGSAWNRRKPKKAVTPSVSVYRTTAQTIPNATDTTLSFNASRWDTHGSWNGSTTLTCRVAGVYDIWAVLKWQTDGTGQRSLHISVGSTVIIDEHAALSGDATQPISGPGMGKSRHYRLAVGDNVTVSVLQQMVPTGSLDVLSAGNYSPEFGMTWLGP